MTLAHRLALPLVTLAALVLGSHVAAAQGAAPLHPSDVVEELTDLGPATSRAIAAAIRTMANAIPAVVDVHVDDRPSGVVEARVLYSYSKNEACVRNQNAEGRPALRAAREACRETRGVEYELVNVRCLPRPGATDGCASADVVWVVSLGETVGTDRSRNRTTLDDFVFQAVDVDADAALEVLVDYGERRYTYDPGDTRGGGDSSTESHELVVVDDDGGVLLRHVISEGEDEAPPTLGASVVVRVSGSSARVSATECAAADDACDRAWRTVALTREPSVVPPARAAPEVHAAVD